MQQSLAELLFLFRFHYLSLLCRWLVPALSCKTNAVLSYAPDLMDRAGRVCYILPALCVQ
jgi:hypothetical protein